jgi:adenylate cyclase class 2
MASTGISNMLEIEAKYPLSDAALVMRRLKEWGAPLVEERSDADHYFNAPDRDFAETDEALRVRRIGSKNLLTYKGPKIDAETKTRKEIEVPFADGDATANNLMAILKELAYIPVALVKKRRQVFEFDRDGFTLQVCLDDVEAVGRFAEIEIVAEESELPRAKALLHRVATELGLSGSERRSYLQLLLERTVSANPKRHG